MFSLTCCCSTFSTCIRTFPFSVFRSPLNDPDNILYLLIHCMHIVGVDWKSLTIPACLPITTDYFPDKRSLHNDYVISDYTLLPDDVNLDYAKSRAIYRKPLTTEEVCTEIVSQRLAQGFQLIVIEEKPNSSPAQAPCCGGLKQQKPTSVLHMKPENEETKEFLLSIGRIFHKITLNGSVITVTGYRPR